MGSRDEMSRAVPCLLCLLPLLVTVQAGGQYWWMGDGDAFGDYQDNQISNNQYQDNGQVQGFNNNNVLPVTQGLGQSQRQTTSCPAVSNVSPVSQCGGRSSDCWSVGQPDVDCIDNALSSLSSSNSLVNLLTISSRVVEREDDLPPRLRVNLLSG